MVRNYFEIHKLIKNSLIVLLGFSLLLSLIDDSFAAAKKKTQKKTTSAKSVEKVISVEAEGIAIISNGNNNAAREEAKRFLYRDALEKAIGAYVESVTQMENYQIVKDKVFSQTSGLVKTVAIKKEWIDENNTFHIIAKCDVVEKALDGILGPAVIDAMGNPRVAVILDERIEDKTSFLSTAESAVLDIFKNSGFSLVESSRTRKLREFDLASYNRADLAKIAHDYNADVIVFGEAYANSYNKIQRLGYRIYNTQSIVRLRAFLTDTEEIIGFKEFSMRDTEGGGSVEDSALRILGKTAAQSAKNIVNQIAYQLASGVSNGNTSAIKVVLNGMDFNTARSIKAYFSEIRGVTRIDQRSLQNGILELDIVSDKTAEILADHLSGKGYKITTVTFKFIEGNAFNTEEKSK